VKRPTYQKLIDARRRAPGFLWLVDPDKIDASNPDPRWARAGEIGVTAFLVGSSQDDEANLDKPLAILREHVTLPLILFPGSASQVSPHFDAVLFLSLLSGRNPEYLVGEQVKGTPLIRAYGIEPIPTGYILVGTGTETSVAKRSQTRPIAEDQADSICDHALCGEFMGHAFIYLEAGSGARKPIARSVIERVRAEISIPLIVGGGLKTPDACADAVSAGADFVVVGTALETDRSEDLLSGMVEATIAPKKTVKV
jgi:putative glycerol-1-phosphate prenyltransferase